jgi:hypothetical protein
MTPAERRAELLGWIAETRRLQRKLAYTFALLGVVAIGLVFVNGTVGAFAILCVALVAIASFWVTAAHNAAHRQKLAELERVERNHGKPLQTAHRAGRFLVVRDRTRLRVIFFILFDISYIFRWIIDSVSQF